MTHFTSKLKEFADENFRFDKNGKKYSKRVDKTVTKIKLLITSNFSFSYSVFRRLIKNQGLFWKGLITNLWEIKHLDTGVPLPQQFSFS